MTAPYAPGDGVRVAEHDPATRRPRPGGRVFPAEVVKTEGRYVQVRYTGGPSAGLVDAFWAESGWRAWDGELRWRLDPHKAGEGDG